MWFFFWEQHLAVKYSPKFFMRLPTFFRVKKGINSGKTLSLTLLDAVIALCSARRRCLQGQWRLIWARGEKHRTCFLPGMCSGGKVEAVARMFRLLSDLQQSEKWLSRFISNTWGMAGENVDFWGLGGKNKQRRRWLSAGVGNLLYSKGHLIFITFAGWTKLST